MSGLHAPASCESKTVLAECAKLMARRDSATPRFWIRLRDAHFALPTIGDGDDEAVSSM